MGSELKRILIIADAPGWCFARRAAALQRYAPENLRIEIVYYGFRDLRSIPYSRYDLIFLLAPNMAHEVRRIMESLSVKTPLVLSHNSGPGREGYSLIDDMAVGDYVICNNYGAWAAVAPVVSAMKNACNISNGVDLKTFRKEIRFTDRPKRVLWCGSESKAHGPEDIKGYRLVLTPLEMVLPSKGIETDFRVIHPGPTMAAEQMNEWYQTGRVLVCASSSEGTPNIALEAAAAGCVVVTSPVGNMPELIDHNRNGLVVDDRQSIPFFEAIQLAMVDGARLSANMEADIIPWDWKIRAEWFYELFNALIEHGPKAVPPFSYLDTAPEDIAP